MAVTKAKVPGVPTPKTPKNTTSNATQVKTTGLSGYLSSSKMKPFVKTIKSQLMS